jgi:hypothetical protein
MAGLMEITANEQLFEEKSPANIPTVNNIKEKKKKE